MHESEESEEFDPERQVPQEPKAFDPSDVGAPPGAPKPVPVSPEMIAEALRNFNEAEIIEAIREIRAGCCHTFEEIMEELEALPSANDHT